MARTKRKVNPITPAAILPDAKRRIYRAAGYIRLSVEDSGKPGADTIEAQKELVLGYIEAQPDMSFVAVYCDNGRTGTNFERPGFEQLMEGIRTNKIDCVVVKDLSRFGRNYKETGSYLEHIFPALDVRFIAINDHFDTLTAEHSSDGYIIPLNVPDVPAQLDYLGLVVTAKHSRISKVIWMMSRRLSSRIITPLLLA